MAEGQGSKVDGDRAERNPSSSYHALSEPRTADRVNQCNGDPLDQAHGTQPQCLHRGLQERSSRQRAVGPSGSEQTWFPYELEQGRRQKANTAAELEHSAKGEGGRSVF